MKKILIAIFVAAFAAQANAAGRVDSGRTRLIADTAARMNRTILGSRTPSMAIIEPSHVTIRTRRAGVYRHTPEGLKVVVPQVEVLGVASDGNLPLTLLAPVSGHEGVEKARKWASTDTITISYRHGTGPEQVLASKVQSTDLVTALDVTVPLKKGETTHLLYSRQGADGYNDANVGGFASGRSIELIWNRD